MPRNVRLRPMLANVAVTTNDVVTLRNPMKAVSEFERSRTLGPIEGGHRIRAKPDSLMALMLTVE